MTAAVALGSFGVIATDTARNFTFTDGSRSYGTTDGRLREVPGGFVVGTGDSPMLEAGFLALGLTGVTDPDRVRETVAETFERVSPRIRAEYPGAEPQRTAFLVLREAEEAVEVLGVQATGEVLGDGPGAFLASWPPELHPDAVRKMYGALRGALARAGGPQAAVRAVARAASIVSPLCPTMSDSLEIAVLRFAGDGFTSSTRSIGCTPQPTT